MDEEMVEKKSDSDNGRTPLENVVDGSVGEASAKPGCRTKAKTYKNTALKILDRNKDKKPCADISEFFEGDKEPYKEIF